MCHFPCRLQNPAGGCCSHQMWGRLSTDHQTACLGLLRGSRPWTQTPTGKVSHLSLLHCPHLHLSARGVSCLPANSYGSHSFSPETEHKPTALPCLHCRQIHYWISLRIPFPGWCVQRNSKGSSEMKKNSPRISPSCSYVGCFQPTASETLTSRSVMPLFTGWWRKQDCTHLAPKWGGGLATDQENVLERISQAINLIMLAAVSPPREPELH